MKVRKPTTRQMFGILHVPLAMIWIGALIGVWSSGEISNVGGQLAMSGFLIVSGVLFHFSIHEVQGDNVLWTKDGGRW